MKNNTALELNTSPDSLVNTMLKLQDIVKTYENGHRAVRGINLDIQHGEFIVLVGPSGCGKSSLLRSIAGLEAINSGAIYLNGRRVDQIKPAQRDIAMVFQNYALYPHMTVYQNLAYGLKNRGVDKGTIEQKIRSVATTLKIEDYLDRKPSKLSGGQRQRVAMGRAIVRDPQLFLFDEPLSNLDAALRSHMRLEIKKLQRELNVTSVYVTHDQVEAMTLADRIVVLKEGSIEQIGTPKEVYHQPASTFVASFIGSPAMNFLPALGQNNSLLVAGQTLTLSSPIHSTTCTLGIRPEQAQLHCDGPSLKLRFKIGVIEPLGPNQLVHGSIVDEQQKAQPFIAMTSEMTLPVNGEIDLFIPLEQLHLFDQMGKRIGSEFKMQ